MKKNQSRLKVSEVPDLNFEGCRSFNQHKKIQIRELSRKFPSKLLWRQSVKDKNFLLSLVSVVAA